MNNGNSAADQRGHSPSARALTIRRYQITNPRLIFLFLFIFSGINVYTQPRDDSQMAQQYVRWIQQAIDEERWNDAAAALARAGDFEGVSSDISYLNAAVNNFFGADRNLIVYHLDSAIETDRWVTYNENHALLLKAEMLIAARNYQSAINCLNMIGTWGGSNAQMRADAAMLRLLALRGIALGTGSNNDYYLPSPGNVQALSQFRSLVLSTMDSYPRDPRPLRIFFEYARNRTPELSQALPESDINLLELAIRRLPFVQEADSDLAWMAAPFIRDIEAARRLLSQYRSGGIPNIRNRDFSPHPGSIPAALNLGLIDDYTAAEELFSASRGFNYPLPPGIISGGDPVIDKQIIIDTYKLLRSEEGRSFFTQKLLSFTGIITCDEDFDGYIDSSAYYHSGVIRHFSYDRDQNNISDLVVEFDANGIPDFAGYNIAGQSTPAVVKWERYPSVKYVQLGHPQDNFRFTDHRWPYLPDASRSVNNETFNFGPVDFQYAPVTFHEIGGSRRMSGLSCPVPAFQYTDLSYRSLTSFCSSITRASTEINGAQETIYLNRGVLLQSVEIFNGRPVSVTEFERGLPAVQYIDLDLDGRMETIRHFRRPPQDYVWRDLLDYRRLVASSESDWRGDGRFKTMEVYHSNGSVVYYYDMDGSGSYNYSEIKY